jgi:arginyl-tRNA synthetase
VESLNPERSFREAIQRAASKSGLHPVQIPLTYPPRAELGDLATPVCFDLARTAKQAPRALAEAIVGSFEPDGVVSRVEAAGAGYINAFYDRQALLELWLHEGPGSTPEPMGPKTIVEHTNINPNKAAHIGHLRNAVLGDTLVRGLRRLGRPVEVQNYIDDTGVQVADLVVGFRVLRDEGLDEVRERYSEERLRERGERFDYVAWDLYAEVTRYYGDDDTRLSHRQETLRLMEDGDNPVAELAAHLSRRMVQYHLMTMDRIGVRYDLLPRESDILTLRFWDTAFERLKQSGAIRRVDEGRHTGCWVMQLADAEEGAGEDEKVIVRSNGTVTYVGKDIAYQMWKFGLLGRDFHYAPFDWAPQRRLYDVWTTSCLPAGGTPPPFGTASTVYNVIDRRQSYLQRVVSQGLLSLGHEEQADRSVHYAYEMVALTPSAVSAMFPDHPLSDEDRRRPYLEMSGRRGLGIRADDLLDAMLARAAEEIRTRNPDMPAERVETTAAQISVGALRYYMLRFSRPQHPGQARGAVRRVRRGCRVAGDERPLRRAGPRGGNRPLELAVAAGACRCGRASGGGEPRAVHAGQARLRASPGVQLVLPPLPGGAGAGRGRTSVANGRRTAVPGRHDRPLGPDGNRQSDPDVTRDRDGPPRANLSEAGL